MAGTAASAGVSGALGLRGACCTRSREAVPPGAAVGEAPSARLRDRQAQRHRWRSHAKAPIRGVVVLACSRIGLEPTPVQRLRDRCLDGRLASTWRASVSGRDWDAAFEVGRASRRLCWAPCNITSLGLLDDAYQLLADNSGSVLKLNPLTDPLQATLTTRSWTRLPKCHDQLLDRLPRSSPRAMRLSSSGARRTPTYGRARSRPLGRNAWPPHRCACTARPCLPTAPNARNHSAPS